MYNCSLFNLFGFCWCCAAFDVAPIFDARRKETKTTKNMCRKKCEFGRAKKLAFDVKNV